MATDRSTKQPSALQHESRAEIICRGEAPELLASCIDVIELPQAARNTFLLVSKKASERDSSNQGEQQAILELAQLRAFLRLECYFPAGNAEPSKRALYHLLRVKDACGSDPMHALECDESAIRLMLGLDSLIQLARIPDILTSPLCMEVFTSAVLISARLTEFHGRFEEPPSASEVRLYEEVHNFEKKFGEKQSQAKEITRIRSLGEKHTRWLLMLRPLLDTEPRRNNEWRVSADRAVHRRVSPDSEFIVKDKTRKKPHRKLNNIKKMLMYYEETLGFEVVQIPKDLA
jgi:hypothetical protein